MAEMTRYQRQVQLAADRFEARVPRIAALKSPALDSSKLTPEKERMLFWTRNVDMDEQQAWLQHMQPVFTTVLQEGQKQGVPPEQLVPMAAETAQNNANGPATWTMYPYRQDVIRAGERVNDTSKQIQFVKRMLEQGPPEDMP